MLAITGPAKKQHPQTIGGGAKRAGFQKINIFARRDAAAFRRARQVHQIATFDRAATWISMLFGCNSRSEKAHVNVDPTKALPAIRSCG
jgi:hypothetical protein